MTSHILAAFPTVYLSKNATPERACPLAPCRSRLRSTRGLLGSRMIPTPLRVSTSTETIFGVGGKKALFSQRWPPVEGALGASEQRSGSLGRKKLLAPVIVHHVRAFYRDRGAGSRAYPQEIDSSFTCHP